MLVQLVSLLLFLALPAALVLSVRFGLPYCTSRLRKFWSQSFPARPPELSASSSKPKTEGQGVIPISPRIHLSHK